VWIWCVTPCGFSVEGVCCVVCVSRVVMVWRSCGYPGWKSCGYGVEVMWLLYRSRVMCSCVSRVVMVCKSCVYGVEAVWLWRAKSYGIVCTSCGYGVNAVW